MAYLTGPVAGGREGYYSGAVAAGEPPGQWWGAGARELGLVGEVDSDLMEAIYARLLDPRDEATHHRDMRAQARTLGRPHKHYSSPQELYEAAIEREPDAGPERRAELLAEAERKSRQPVAFFDMTFSPSKSITVLSVAFERAANEADKACRWEEAEAWRAMNTAVEQAVMAGARASIDYLQEHAGYARVGKHGGGANRWGDANKFVVAQFLQHDSRERDPQLHVHQAILNKLERVDGEWTGVDERALKLHKMSAGVIGQRVMEAELARTLGMRFEVHADHAREVAGVDRDVMELFSSRRRQVTAKAAELIAEYEARHGREASVYEQKYLREQATLLTRKAKSHDGETNEQRLDRWEREARGAMEGGLAKVARDALAARDSGPAEEWSLSQVIARALAEVGKNQGTWTRSDLMWSLSNALPANLGVDASEVRGLLDGLADQALDGAVVVVATEDADGLPSEFQLRNGLSAFQRPGAAKYATPGQLVDERLRDQAAVRVGAAQLTDGQVELVMRRLADAGVKLGVDQAGAVRGVATSGACVEVLEAAAGTGKSFTVGTLAELWAQYGRRTIGLTASQRAADVMSEEGVPTAFNFEKWRVSVERESTWQLRDGDLVVVDEAGMASTQDVADIARRCEEAGAKLLLVGDSKQLGAVGPGGSLADVGAIARRYELTDVRRFDAEWEREASLRLRDGDVSALDDYDKHGRLRSCGTAEEAEADAGRAWLADTLAGKQSLLMVASNEQAGRLSGRMRAELVRLGKVSEAGVALGWDGNTAGVGDMVRARRNDWRLDVPVINQQEYRVLETLDGGGLRVETSSGTAVTLPAGYVAGHLSLAYASTLHAAQGRTVDTAHDLTGTYVGMTRGRESNTAWVTTQPLASDAPVGEAQDVKPRTAKAVLADVAERAEEQRGALTEQAQALEDERSEFRTVDRLLAGIAESRAGTTSRTLDLLAARDVITPEQREALAADQAMGSVDRLLRYAEVSGRDPEQVLTDALDGKSLSGATSVGRVLHKRIRSTLDEKVPQITSYRDLIPAGTDERWRTWLEGRADAADERRHELGARVAEEQPPWAMETLGPVPEDPLRRAVWESRAGWAAAHRENMEHDDEQDPIGAAPPAGLAEKHAIWATAHATLDLPDVGPEEAMLTDGQLLVRAAAWDREQALAPRYVADELAATSERVADRRAQAGLWRAHADTLDDTEKPAVLADAEKAEREADELEQRVLDLEEADKARTTWFLHSAGTRDRGERSKAELGRRGVDLVNPPDKTTAAEWLAAEQHDRVAGDAVRPIREEDLADEQAVDIPAAQQSPETDVADLRDVAIADPTEHDPRVRREVPDADTTAESVRRARETLLEVESRDAADQARLDEEAGMRQQQWLSAPEQSDEHARVREMS